MKRLYTWKDGKTCVVGERPIVMGILNVTPDSFSDGGRWDTLEKALPHTRDMIESGAGMIDVGAESTRPGHTPLMPEEETERLLRFLKPILKMSTVPVSIDTYHYKTARAGLESGAHILNDVWGLQYDDGSMAKVAAEYGVPAILMHNRHNHVYERDIIEELKLFFDKTVNIALSAGVKEDCIILDPGIGFGKNEEQNLEVVSRLGELTPLFPYPWLLGVSRKRFIGAVLHVPTEERDEATGAVNLWGLEAGCHIFRVHDVKTTVRMMDIWNAMRQWA